MPMRSRARKQPARARVPDADREHAVEAVDARRGPTPRSRGRCTSVSEWSVRKRCPFATSSRPQLPVVVDLAVEDDRDRAVLVAHRLVRGRREVDDREPAVAEPDLAVR